MKKDFWKWHALKTKLNDRESQKFFHEREIWFCSLGINIGREQDGRYEWFKRPVLILKKFNQEMFFGIPLTSQYHQSQYHFQFSFNGQPSYAILSQLRLLDSKRLLRKFGMI